MALATSTSHDRFNNSAQLNIRRDSVLKPTYKNDPKSRLVIARNNLIAIDVDPRSGQKALKKSSRKRINQWASCQSVCCIAKVGQGVLLL